MRVRGRYAGLLASVLTTGVIAQPYGMGGWMDHGHYWTPLGTFQADFDNKAQSGSMLAFAHPNGRSQFELHDSKWQPYTVDRSSVLIAEVWNEEQLAEGHGSYWQVEISATVDCAKNTAHVDWETFYNKPRLQKNVLRDEWPADQLWHVDVGAAGLTDAGFAPIKDGSLGAAAAKLICAAPIGPAPMPDVTK